MAGMHSGACLLALCWACGWAVQTEPAGVAPEVLLLARIRLKMEQNLARLPNYTCIQTIERSRRRGPSRRFELSDTLRLEVALAGGKELFAWPGAQKFEERDLMEMVGGGTIGNGEFALHARTLFLTNVPRFTYAGEETCNGRRAVRYDFSVPRMRSGYRIRVPPNEGVVGYHGTFWADAETLDLMRLKIVVDDIPPNLPLAGASDTLEYRRVRIGEGDFLLPGSGELVMVDLAGNENRNRAQFSACRQYTGQSTLSFGEIPGEQPPVRQTAVSEIRLPPGLVFDLALNTEIDSATAAAGDPVSAVLTKSIRENKQVLVPKGAVFFGRLTRMERRGGPQPGIAVGLQFDLAEFGTSRVFFAANLDDMQNVLAPRGALMASAWRIEPGRRPGEGCFYVRTPRLRLARGHRTTWRTIPFTEQEKP